MSEEEIKQIHSYRIHSYQSWHLADLIHYYENGPIKWACGCPQCLAELPKWEMIVSLAKSELVARGEQW